MPSLFTRPEDRAFALTISKLAYCNPFIEERVLLEQRALGEDFDPKAAKWNLDPRSDMRYVNHEKILARIESLMQALRDRYLKENGSEAERAAYVDMVFFLLYHQLAEQMDQVIIRAHQDGSGRRRIGFYGVFLEAFRSWLGESSPVEPAHLFACFFQIRRAFYHIFHFFVGASLAATQLRARIWQSIFTYDLGRYQRALWNRMNQIPTLITGPSGSGKEVVARAIGLSQYIAFDERERVFSVDFVSGFYPINLSALSPTLIESELFGHRRGAFTGALQDREGYFSACGEGGTVFLDEIGETDLGVQVKLLRVLQTRRFQRLGDVSSEAFRGKIVAATNRDLVSAISSGRFREDFYYRLRSDLVTTPGLDQMLAGSARELPFLVNHIAETWIGSDEASEVAKSVMDWCQRHPEHRWQGNFRELEQAVRSILVHGDYVPANLSSGGDQLARQMAETGWTLKDMTSVYITELYRQTPNFEELARRLEVDRRTVKKYLNEVS